MAEPDVVRGTYITILLGNGADPEVFPPICGITTRNFSHQANTNDTGVRDCADPESVPVRRLIVTSEQWDLSGSGQLNRAQLGDLNGAFGVPKNYRFVIGEPADDVVFGGYYYGQGVLTRKNIGGGDTDFATIELTIASDGRWNWQDV